MRQRMGGWHCFQGGTFACRNRTKLLRLRKESRVNRSCKWGYTVRYIFSITVPTKVSTNAFTAIGASVLVRLARTVPIVLPRKREWA